MNEDDNLIKELELIEALITTSSVVGVDKVAIVLRYVQTKLEQIRGRKNKI